MRQPARLLTLGLAITGFACGKADEEPALPDCFVAAEFRGALQGTIHITDSDGNCGGRSYEGFAGGNWSEDVDPQYLVAIALADTLILTPGTNVADVPAEFNVEDRDRTLTFQAYDCSADVDITEHEHWTGPKIFVTGTVTCSDPFSYFNHDEEAELVDSASFSYIAN